MEERVYQLIDGKAVAAQAKKELAAEVANIKQAGGKIPHLAAILVGHDGGSETYVMNKVKSCEAIGFWLTLIRCQADITEEELLRKVQQLNEDDDVDGFIVQLPLPKHISSHKVIEAIDYRKDVDSFHHEAVVEWFPDVFRVMFLCKFARHGKELRGDENEPPVFEPFDDFADQGALDAVGFNADKCFFHGIISPYPDLYSGASSRPASSDKASISGKIILNVRRSARILSVSVPLSISARYFSIASSRRP